MAAKDARADASAAAFETSSGRSAEGSGKGFFSLSLTGDFSTFMLEGDAPLFANLPSSRFYLDVSTSPLQRGQEDRPVAAKGYKRRDAAGPR
jgi:hypothetical protein